MESRRLPTPTASTRAFTLIEVILAVGIAVILLSVALYFYQQAAHFRAQLIQESERASTIRLVMDRMTADLRAAFAVPQYGFTGDATSMLFVRAGPPGALVRANDLNARPASDLRLVSYGVNTALEGTNWVITGLTRTERPLIEARTRSGSTPPEAVPSVATNEPPSAVTPPATPTPPIPPLSDSIRFLHLWYWDGWEWSETWDSTELPLGVEISLGAEPLPPDGSPADYPGELYRRVIHLPAGRASEPLDFFARSGSRPPGPGWRVPTLASSRVE